jgi:hypothetical protein
MRTFEWEGYEWITQERWGQVHPEKSHWWYDESCVFVDNQDQLHLTTKYNPKKFDELNVTSPIGVGLVSCTEKFSHGIFTIEAKLPTGENLWPAFWMWSWDEWPPEIDVFEGYSDNNSDYLKLSLGNPFGFWNVQTNLHYKENGESKMLGGKTHYYSFKNPVKHFIKYTLDWSKEYVKFYYNDRLVRTINEPSILRQLNSTTMNVVINNGVTKEVNKETPPISDFIVKSFNYKQKI